MNNYNFSIEDDTLIKNEITETDDPMVFSVKKVPIITKEVFSELYKMWINNDEKEEEHK